MDTNKKKSLMPYIALILELICVPLFYLGLMVFFVNFLIGFILCLASISFPFISITFGIVSIFNKKNLYKEKLGFVLSILVVAIPIITIITVVILFSTGVLVIRFM